MIIAFDVGPTPGKKWLITPKMMRLQTGQSIDQCNIYLTFQNITNAILENGIAWAVIFKTPSCYICR